MIEGIVRFYYSVKEPEDKNLIWFRPKLDKEGFDFLYYGSKGWMPWIPDCKRENHIHDDCKETEPGHIPGFHKKNPCGCN